MSQHPSESDPYLLVQSKPELGRVALQTPKPHKGLGALSGTLIGEPCRLSGLNMLKAWSCRVYIRIIQGIYLCDPRPLSTAAVNAVNDINEF